MTQCLTTDLLEGFHVKSFRENLTGQHIKTLPGQKILGYKPINALEYNSRLYTNNKEISRIQKANDKNATNSVSQSNVRFVRLEKTPVNYQRGPRLTRLGFRNIEYAI